MHVLARLLAVATMGLIVLAAPAASAQVDPCLANPASCVPSAPDPGACASDPASCLLSVPGVDGCVAEPSSCVPSAPDPDPCLANPSSCVPSVPDPGPCVQDPISCLPVGGAGAGTRNQLRPAEGRTGTPQDQGGPDAPVVAGVGEDREPRRAPPADRAPERPAGAARPVSGISLVTAPRPQPDADGAFGGLGGLAQAVRDFAFPIALLLGVGVFLAIQSRIDRKDPKLAMAPVSSRHDVVEFA